MTTREPSQKEQALTEKLTVALAKTYEKTVGAAIREEEWSYEEVFTVARNCYARLLMGNFWNIHQTCPDISIESTAQAFCDILMINARRADEQVGTNVPDEAKH